LTYQRWVKYFFKLARVLSRAVGKILTHQHTETGDRIAPDLVPG